jgi:hypothetical protein
MELNVLYMCTSQEVVGMSCVCKDNHLLRCSIDIYCSSTLYTGELD